MHPVASPKRPLLPRSLLIERAVGMRTRPTASERRIWDALRANACGVEFRRQVPLGGRSVADFLAPTHRLVVEVDGPFHARRGRADAQRDRALARRGYRVLRLQAELVERDFPAAIQLITAELEWLLP